MLFVVLPKITLSFEERLLQGDWVIIGFLLSASLSMMIGRYLGGLFGRKKVFVFSQCIYIASLVACGFANHLNQLIIFRIVQGFFAGIMIPLGISYWHSAHEGHPQEKGDRLYLYEMIFALGLGPIYAGYVTQFVGWRWLFFIKAPFSILFLLASLALLPPTNPHKGKPFHWKAFIAGSIGFYLFLLGINLLGDLTVHWGISLFLIVLSGILFMYFFHFERTHAHPIIQFSLFKDLRFSLAIILQSCVMIVFLAAIFILSLFLIGALKFTIIQTGWVLSSLGLGMLAAMAIIKVLSSVVRARFLVGFGVLLVAFSMFSLTKVTIDTNIYRVAGLVFLEGLGAWLVRVMNAKVIFSSTPNPQLEDASKIYTLNNQMMATIGIALTTMILKINLVLKEIPSLSWATPEIAKQAYHSTFVVLSLFPLIGFVISFLLSFKVRDEEKT